MKGQKVDRVKNFTLYLILILSYLSGIQKLLK